MSAKEVATILRTNTNWVYRNKLKLDGIQLSNKGKNFLPADVIGDLKRANKNEVWEMASSQDGPWDTSNQGLPNKRRSQKMGSRAVKSNENKDTAPYRHGI